jgi:outer membrane receptor protein involved in Fe transport
VIINYKNCILLLFYWLSISNFISASTNGNIYGKVFNTENDSPLVGANVIIINNNIGTATDNKGLYNIINILPGNYTLRVSMIGFADYEIKDLTISMNRTTYVEVGLTPDTIKYEAIIVQAERPLVKRDISASVLNIQDETIQSLPATNLEDIISLQAGVTGMFIRGGSPSQTALFVDGFRLNDERSNHPFTTININAIKEIHLQTGGFNAEYGNIRSGIINIMTIDGSEKNYSASLSLWQSDKAPKHFGKSLYDEDSYFLRPYLDDDVCWTGTNSGVWDNYTERQYPAFEGWNSISLFTMNDSDPSNDLTPTAAQKIFKWQHRRNGAIRLPDYSRNLLINGPLPFQSKHLVFSLSHTETQDVFIIPLSRDSYNSSSTVFKLTGKISEKIRISISSLYGTVSSVSPYDWKVTPTGLLINSSSDVAELINGSTGNSILFMPGYYSPTEIYRYAFGLKINHILSEKMFYEVILQQMGNQYNTYQLSTRDTTKNNMVVDGFYFDEAPFGYWGYSETSIDGMNIGGWMNLGRDKSSNVTSFIKLDLTKVLNKHHQIKTGFEYVMNDYRINSSTVNPSMDTWNREMSYYVSPRRNAVYVQDKIDHDGVIANIGLRVESTVPNTNWYDLEPYDKNLSQGEGANIETQVPTYEAEHKYYISPRLGISHPITENSKLYFNYGHFYSEPESSFRFRIQREYNGLVTHLGNPGLSNERTIAYEIGYAHSWNELLLNLAAYYKDVTDQAGWIYFEDVRGSVSYSRAGNNNYADIRGLELTISKPRKKWISGFINYTYMVNSTGYFGFTHNYQDPNKMRQYLQLNPYLEKPKPQPFARVNLDFTSPENFGPGFSGLHPFEFISLSLLYTYKAGAFDTYNPNNIPGIQNNIQWKDNYNVDLRLMKKLSIGRNKIEFFLDITNALNRKKLSPAGFSDYFDYIDYLESLKFNWEDGIEHGNDRVGEFRNWNTPYDPLESNPNNDPLISKRNELRKKNKSYIDMPNLKGLCYLDPRKISIGARYNF